LSKSSLVASAVVLAVTFALSGCGQATGPEALAKARQALEKDDLKTAQIHLKGALQTDPQMAEARYLLGKVLLEVGDSQGALVELGKAIEAGYPTKDLAVVHSQALLAQRESRKLLDLYGKLELAETKEQSALLMQIGRAQQRLDREADARVSFVKAQTVTPGYAPAEVELAILDAQAGKLQVALDRVNALLEKQPSEGAAWRLKGDLELAHKSDKPAARSAYERAVKESPKSVEAQLALVGFLMGEKDWAAVDARIKQATQRIGQNFGLRFYAAAMDMEQGKLDAAHEQAQQLLRAAPEDGRVLLLAGQIEYLRERFLQAESHLSRAVGSGGNAQRARMLLAQTYLRLDDPARTVQTLQPLLDEQVRIARVHALAGEAFSQLGESRKAEEQFRKAAELDPKDTRSRTMLAMGQMGKGQDARGLAELKELSEGFDSPVADLALISTFVRKGDFASALQAIDAAEKKMPERAGMVASLRAQVLRAQGKPAEASAALEAALKRDPKYLPAALALAREDLSAKQVERAVQRIEGVAKADPSNVMAQLALINVRQQAGEPAEKLEADLKSLIQKHPQVARPRVALVKMQVRRGDLAAAAATAQQGVATLPSEGELLEMLAEVQVRQREFTLANKTLAQLSTLRPRAVEPLTRMAEVDMMSGKAREAMASVRKALALRPTYVPALRLQIGLETELGNVEAARRYVKELQALPGQEALGAAVEGDLETSQQQLGVAQSAYRRALARNAGLPEVPARLHRVLRANGKSDEADAFVRDWFKDHPRDLGFLNYLGDLALGQGELAQARQHYEKSLALRADQALVLNNLAWLTLQQGAADKAEQQVREALKLAPAEAPLHDTLSAILSARGQHEPAIAAQRDALQRDSNPVFRVGLARRLLAAGRKDAARDELLAVQQLGDRYPGQAEVRELLSKQSS
jgi:cellulose synthase operon protein C